MKDFRIEENNKFLNYTCQNQKFKTNIEKGKPHGKNRTKGSATGAPLVDSDDYSLWLEHVTSKDDPDAEYYWFMWYNKGTPVIPLSGVFTSDDLVKMIEQLVKLTI